MSTREWTTVKTTIINKLKQLFSFLYHLCTSADLHGNIASRIADANHQHPLASVSIWISVVPAVKAFSRKFLVSWRDEDDTNGNVTFPVWKWLLSHVSELTYLGSPPAVKTDRWIDPNTPEPHRTHASLPLRRCSPSLCPTDQSERSLASERPALLSSETIVRFTIRAVQQ